MMGEHWWSLNGKLQPPTFDQQTYNPTLFTTPSLPLHVPPPSFILNPPYHFESSLLNPNALADHQIQDFPLSWSQLPLNGSLAIDQEQYNWGAGHDVGEVKHAYLDNQQSRQVYCSSNNEEDLKPVQSVGSSSTMFNFSSKIVNRRQYSSQYDDTTTSGASKKPRFQSSSNSEPSSICNGTSTNGTSKRAWVQHMSTESPLKVRKEKSGRDKIYALHQLVSPFGKTDMASVLLEATVQIKFFEAKIEALSLPYMNLANKVSGGTRHQHSADGEALPKDLASRGLCLVPVTCMDHIDTTNMTSLGAEFWTQALASGFLELGGL